MNLMVVKGKDEIDFVAQVNKSLDDFKENFDVKIDYPAELTAYITLEDKPCNIKQAEIEGRCKEQDRKTRPVTQEFHDEGIIHTCIQCPFLEVGNDARRKWWPCKYSDFGTSTCNRECCEKFYKMLQQGEAQLIDREARS